MQIKGRIIIMKRNPEKKNYSYNYSDSLDHHWKLTATKNNDDQHQLKVNQMKGLVKQWKIPTERNSGSCGGTETHSGTTNAASICMIVNRDDIEVPTDLQFEFNAPGPVPDEEQVIETPPNRRRDISSLPRTMNHPAGSLHPPAQGIYKNFKLTAEGFTEKVSQSQPNEKHFKLTKHGQMKEKKIIL